MARHLMRAVQHRHRREWLEKFEQAHGREATAQLKIRLLKLWSSMSGEERQRDRRCRKVGPQQGRSR
jgi:hypothetical protein